MQLATNKACRHLSAGGSRGRGSGGSVPKRVALVIGSCEAGGAERHAITLAERLDSESFETELVALKAEGDLFEEIRSLGIAFWTPSAAKGVDLSAALRLTRHWQQQSVDVVIAANSYASIMVWLASRFMSRRPRLLSTFHSSPQLYGSDRLERAQLRFYSWVLRSFDGLIYVSGLQRSAWAACRFARGVRATHVFNGIDVDRFVVPVQVHDRVRFGWKEHDFVIGMCARLSAEKRIEDLLEAMSVLVEEQVPGKLLVIGDGTERANLEESARRTLPPGTVVFAGFQSDVVPFVHACDVMALVSDSEAFSMSVLESMACGKPVVLTDVGGASEQIEHGVHGYLVPTRSPEQIAERLMRIWRNGEASQLGANGLARVMARFSVETMVRRYERLLLSIAWSDDP